MWADGRLQWAIESSMLVRADIGGIMARSVRTSLLTVVIAAALVYATPLASQGTIIVAMTAGDIPVTTGNPDQGFEGFRFVALNLYDALVGWDLSNADKPSTLKPGLATEWHVDPESPRRWLFTVPSRLVWKLAKRRVSNGVIVGWLRRRGQWGREQ